MQVELVVAEKVFRYNQKQESKKILTIKKLSILSLNES
jgi:hypothetical protein